MTSCWTKYFRRMKNVWEILNTDVISEALTLPIQDPPSSGIQPKPEGSYFFSNLTDHSTGHGVRYAILPGFNLERTSVGKRFNRTTNVENAGVPRKRY